MAEEKRCAECGTILSADAPHGICPVCALHQGLGASLDAGAIASDGVPTPAELATLFPDLEILNLIGRGGMGAVYKARQRSLDRLVALKILSPTAGKDPAFSERFSREAKALAKLNHPHIVAVYDSGEVDGLFYFLMEYVDGMNLRELMAQGRRSPSQVLAIVAQICEGLQYAHDAGVVHRDIKPDNILLDKNFGVKIADFGVAKLANSVPSDLTLTEPGGVMGTAYYMAPEQLERPEEVDHRADIYSLGVVFYQLLTGELPVGRFALPSQKSQVGGELDEVVLKTLEREPQRRFQRADEVGTQLQQIASTPSPANAKSPGGMEQTMATQGADTKKILAVVLLPLVLLAIASVAAFIVLRSNKASAPQTRTGQESFVTPRANNASPSKPWSGPRSPLMRAVGHSSDEVRQMIAEGYGVNEHSKDGVGAPLHIAAYMGDRGYKAAQLLVEAGANVNAGNNSSEQTPLMLAAANNGVKLVEYLLSKGADVNAIDRRGRTALDYAEYHKHEAVISILKEAGAKPGTGIHITPKAPPDALRSPVQTEPASVEVEKTGDQ